MISKAGYLNPGYPDLAKVLRHRDVSTTQIYVHDSPVADDVWKRVDALHFRPRKLAKDDE